MTTAIFRCGLVLLRKVFGAIVRENLFLLRGLFTLQVRLFVVQALALNECSLLLASALVDVIDLSAHDRARRGVVGRVLVVNGAEVEIQVQVTANAMKNTSKALVGVNFADELEEARTRVFF